MKPLLKTPLRSCQRRNYSPTWPGAYATPPRLTARHHNVGEALSAFLQPNVLCVSAREFEEVSVWTERHAPGRWSGEALQARGVVRGPFPGLPTRTWFPAGRRGREPGRAVQDDRRPGTFNGPEHERAWAYAAPPTRARTSCAARRAAGTCRSRRRERSATPPRRWRSRLRRTSCREGHGRRHAGSLPYREAVYLHYYEGMSIGQIARRGRHGDRGHKEAEPRTRGAAQELGGEGRWTGQ